MIPRILLMYCFAKSGYLKMTEIRKLARPGMRYFMSLSQFAMLVRIDSVRTE
jgi:hypothetical protein